MFKASIALVLIAFGALAYGWLSNNDTILYASIGASILAGLFLLRATVADRKAGYAPEPKAARPERPAREPRERKPKKGEAAPAGRQRRGRLDSDELTGQIDVAPDDEDEEPLSSLRPKRGRRDRLPSAPAGAAWAEAEQGYDDTEFEEEDQGMGPPSYDADYGDEEYDDDYAAPAAQAQGAAADDFRSRLAAVLGSAGEEAPPPPPAKVAPRARRVTPVTPEIDEAPPVAPKRRGRRKPEPFMEPEPEPEYQDASEEEEPEWVRIEDVPKVSRPAPTDEMIHYRPRRPAVASVPEEAEQDEPDKPPAPRRRSASSEVRPVGGKRPPTPRSSGVTRVSPAEKTTRARSAKPRDPDAPPPRRGRPPRPKP